MAFSHGPIEAPLGKIPSLLTILSSVAFSHGPIEASPPKTDQGEPNRHPWHSATAPLKLFNEITKDRDAAVIRGIQPRPH